MPKLFNNKNMTMMEPKHFTKSRVNHDKFKGKNGMIIIAADWCGYCQQVKEPWIQFKKIAMNKFAVGAVDAVKYPEITKKLGISGFPTILIVDEKGKFEVYTGDRDIYSFTNQLCLMETKHPICK